MTEADERKMKEVMDAANLKWAEDMDVTDDLVRETFNDGFREGWKAGRQAEQVAFSKLVRGL